MIGTSERSAVEIERLIDATADLTMSHVAVCAGWIKLVLCAPLGYTAVVESAESIARGGTGAHARLGGPLGGD